MEGDVVLADRLRARFGAGLARTALLALVAAAPSHAEAPLTLEAAFGAPPAQILLAHGVPGAQAALVAGGRVVDVVAVGRADGSTGAAVTDESLFQAASISKAVTAWVVLALAQSGRLDLDAPLDVHLGGFRIPGEDTSGARVTARRVLSHTAGLSVGGYLGFEPGVPLQGLVESLRGARDAGGQIVRVLQPPGASFRYSGGGYTLLQLAVQEITGEPFDVHAKRAVLEPLGMKHSGFAPTATVAARLVHSYDLEGHDVAPARFTAQAAAGLYTTARDLGRFAASLSPGPGGEPAGRGVLTPASVAALLTPQPGAEVPGTGGAERWGLGYGLDRLGEDGPLLAFHPGDNVPGFHAMLAVLPEAGAGLVVLTNGEGGREVRLEATCLWLARLTKAEAPLCTSPDAIR